MKKICFALILFASVYSVEAQYATKYYQNILDDKIYDYIVAESSGEKALNYAADLASYELGEPRDFDNLKESEYVMKKLSEFGIKTVKLNRYDGAKAWSAKKGVLYEVTPKYDKLADFTDIPAQLCNGSKSIKLDSVELVWVGLASVKELEAVDLTGKIAFGDAPVYVMHDKCVEKGALGVVSCFSPRIVENDALQVLNLGLYSGKPTFGFQLTARDGFPLRDRIIGGQKVYVSCEIESQNVEFQYQSPECVIEGTNPQSGEIILSAHLFEGYYKLGANDNVSGSVVLLEVARALNTLISEGKLERPERSVRFIWGDEFNGIMPWVKEQKEIIDRTLFNINMDMVGIGLNKGDTWYCLHRNRLAMSHYSSDLSEAMMDYMQITNQKSIIVGDFLKPVVAKNGSKDMFRYTVTPYYSASDHSIFCDWGVGIPAVMMITWPDKNYHSSRDRVEFLDATQLKRAAVISASIAYSAAVAGEKEAMKFAGFCLSGASRRLALVLASEFDALAKDCSDSVIKRALNDMDAFALTEAMAIRSVNELSENSSELKNYTEDIVVQLNMQRDAAKNSLLSYYNASSQKPYSEKLTSAEKKASQTFYSMTPKVKEGGYNILGHWLAGLSEERRSQFNRLGIVGIHDLSSLTAHENLSLYDMKKIIDYEHRVDMSLESISDFFDMLTEDKFLEPVKK